MWESRHSARLGSGRTQVRILPSGRYNHDPREGTVWELRPIVVASRTSVLSSTRRTATRRDINTSRVLPGRAIRAHSPRRGTDRGFGYRSVGCAGGSPKPSREGSNPSRCALPTSSLVGEVSAPIAQWTVQRSSKPMGPGSNPGRGAMR